LHAAATVTVEDVRASPPLVQFSAAMATHSKALKGFLFRNVYRHCQVMRQMDLAQQVVRDLFSIYLERPQEMQVVLSGATSDHTTHRIIADYIAGMTDRFAMREHERLTGQRVLV